jgi:hypothetical protein
MVSFILVQSESVNRKLCRPVDNFISACLSCHSVSQRIPGTDDGQLDSIVQPWPMEDTKGQLIPGNDDETMKWCNPLLPQHVLLLSDL